MPAETTARTPQTRSGRVPAVRSSSLRAMIVPGMVGPYLAATWQAGNRPVMLAVAVAMIAVAGLNWWQAPVIARSAYRSLIRGGAMLVTVAGGATLTLLDGGVGSPLGSVLPFSLLFYAVRVPARMFLAACVFISVAYWTIVVLGDPVPSGYAAVYTLGVGGVAAICFRHAAALRSLRRRLARMSVSDPLTRCLNRRGFDERLEAAYADAVRTGRPVSVVVVDLDRFKEVNDEYGHQAGDDLLAWTANTMTAELRQEDVVGRLGGDEFAVVLAGSGPEEADAVVERLRAALDGVAPASFGRASYPAEASDLDDLRRRADHSAYADKAGSDRREPTAEGVARARREAGRRAATKVSRRERRRRSIADMGRLTASDCTVGVVYAALFAHGEPHRVLMGVLCGLGLLYGLAVVATAGRLSRSPVVGPLMLVNGLLLCALAVAVPVLNGGVGSATGVAMLAPMPLIALGAPLRVAVPALALGVGAYLTVAVALGAPSPWYVAMHLAGILAVAAACAFQGHSAARQRLLLTRLSKVDPLTDVLNRRGFEERFLAELEDARRTGRSLGLLIFDLDGFKLLNDTAGHAAGDELLRWVAGTLRAGLPEQDVVGRLGGDEFVVVLRSATEVAAAAERLRRALAERTPASLGTAVLNRDGTDFEALYLHADAELYAEKASRTRAPRRNRPVRSPVS
ncbi:GGDEF domain-containing protein [Actinoplanes sp. NPDC049548]|uniref:GGDEF domain-containing protein n=1 Tax=Actinoplanes sp. NPDC049548 TaxID=3155152 RepID=UPI00343D9375